MIATGKTSGPIGAEKLPGGLWAGCLTGFFRAGIGEFFRGGTGDALHGAVKRGLRGKAGFKGEGGEGRALFWICAQCKDECGDPVAVDVCVEVATCFRIDGLGDFVPRIAQFPSHPVKIEFGIEEGLSVPHVGFEFSEKDFESFIGEC